MRRAPRGAVTAIHGEQMVNSPIRVEDKGPHAVWLLKVALFKLYIFDLIRLFRRLSLHDMFLEEMDTN